MSKAGLRTPMEVAQAAEQLRLWADQLEAFGEDASAKVHFVAVWDEEGTPAVEALTLGNKATTSEAFVGTMHAVTLFMQGKLPQGVVELSS